MRRSLVLVAAVPALAACGGSSSSGHDDFVKQANRVCKDKRAAVAAIPRPAALVAVSDYLARAAPRARAQRDAIAALEPPTSDRREVRRLLSAWQGVLAALAGMSRGAQTGDDALVALGLKAAHRFDEAGAVAAKKLGITECTHLNPFSSE